MGMPHASVYIDLLSCLVTFCVRAMTMSLGCCHRSKCHALLFVHAHCSFAAVSSSARDKGYRNPATDTYLNVYDACVFLKFVVG